jgi:tRNA (cytidine/uridine-2'-O-)-methyltransferase
MLHVALLEPEIPPNTGNIARLCAATNTALHVVGATGFRMDDRTLRRAGLDYWDHVSLFRHIDLDLIFGPETRGIPADVLSANADRCLTIPMANPNVRSLNLSTSVGIVLYEAIRQTRELFA